MHKHSILIIQALRAYAAAIVVIYHTQHIMAGKGLIDDVSPLLKFGQSGVDIFFVVSGFIMVFISWDNFGKAGASADFILRRLIRIVPLYWFYSIAVTLVLVVFPDLLSQGGANIPHIIASYLFIPWENNIGVVMPVLPVGWTLSYEMYFYIVFSVALFFRNGLFLPLAIVWLLGGVFLGMVIDFSVPMARLMTSGLLVEFFIGCLVGFLYKTNARISPHLSVLLFLIGAAAYVFMVFVGASYLTREAAWGVPAGLIIIGLVFMERHRLLRVPAFLIKLGDSSYSLYLSHLFTVHLGLLIWNKLVGANYELFSIIVFLFSLVVAHFSYLIIERPSMLHLTALYKRSKFAPR